MTEWKGRQGHEVMTYGLSAARHDQIPNIFPSGRTKEVLKSSFQPEQEMDERMRDNHKKRLNNKSQFPLYFRYTHNSSKTRLMFSVSRINVYFVATTPYDFSEKTHVNPCGLSFQFPQRMHARDWTGHTQAEIGIGKGMEICDLDKSGIAASFSEIFSFLTDPYKLPDKVLRW